MAFDFTFNQVRKLPFNSTGRDFVVGDLHGCLDVLHRALRALNFQPTLDRLFSVGDLVDRGPYSLACLGLLKKPWFHAVMGNHEFSLLRHLAYPETYRPLDPVWLDATGSSFTQRRTLAQQWLPTLAELPLVIQVGFPFDFTRSFQLIHAELVATQTITNGSLRTWDFSTPARDQFIQGILNGRALMKTWQRGGSLRQLQQDDLRLTYCGHSIVRAPLLLARQLFIDGGAFLGYRHHRLHPDGQFTLGNALVNPGLFLAEPQAQRFWFAPTNPLSGPNILPAPLLTPDFD